MFGSSQQRACVPLPWWTSKSTTRTFSTAKSRRALGVPLSSHKSPRVASLAQVATTFRKQKPIAFLEHAWWPGGRMQQRAWAWRPATTEAHASTAHPIATKAALQLEAFRYTSCSNCFTTLDRYCRVDLPEPLARRRPNRLRCRLLDCRHVRRRVHREVLLLRRQPPADPHAPILQPALLHRPHDRAVTRGPFRVLLIADRVVLLHPHVVRVPNRLLHLPCAQRRHDPRLWTSHASSKPRASRSFGGSGVSSCS
mmetsp:Transcript_16916/g.52848  ORF Transcript_16916/g.52848 Transcript_16916/m.52848 type:complete len:254 (+) Transcript_16916:1074-1835(+)